MKKKGLPALESSRRGDQLVRIQVVTPQKLSEEEAQLLKELSKYDDRHVTDGEEGFFEKVKNAFSS